MRKEAGALAVVVVRVNDSVLAADPGLAPGDADALVCENMRELARNLEAARREKRKAARLELKPVRE